MVVPESASIRTVTVEDWVERGRLLAAMTPSRFTLPPDRVMDLLDAAATRASAGDQAEPDLQMTPVRVQMAHLRELCTAT